MTVSLISSLGHLGVFTENIVLILRPLPPVSCVLSSLTGTTKYKKNIIKDDLELFTSKKAEETKQQQSQLKSDEKSRTSPVASPPSAASTTQTPPATKPKRTLGIFSRRNADARPTDLNTLIGPNAQAPELAALLAQILTFGAPGRFPKVTSWKRPMPFVTYDAEVAKAMLTESRADADLTEEQSAEIFASVVNCMIIDIVDLASSTLKAGKKDDNEKVTVDAINVVMDFMDHAASLFDAVSKVRSRIHFPD